MKAVIQRVKSASVTVDNQLISQIGRGLLVLVGVSRDDTVEDAEKIASRILRLKLWEDAETKAPWKTNVAELKFPETETLTSHGQVLCVSQFTLYANIKKGAKPDFHRAAKGDIARELYAKVLDLVAAGMPNGKDDVKDGVFGAMMDVALVNDGPVTIEVDSRA
ncbi:uncharacterized protein SAPINGB_P004051 [Magnusiomyces paraingens]|uniref:D-aminoacyl-tRNA deacylase n=1 Tax=Magnusiomyces paraingens TaxID=2606893 RepID=A0A5E8BUQ0_9ASCO|nr:uncharacterized protein SAPINGB_P004051 [Saprochaete ingens]VVT54389.1 unnamed protein product [Saprochaete ingens]